MVTSSCNRNIVSSYWHKQPADEVSSLFGDEDSARSFPSTVSTSRCVWSVQSKRKEGYRSISLLMSVCARQIQKAVVHVFKQPSIQ